MESNRNSRNMMPTLKAIHICNSFKPAHKSKIAKEYVFAQVNKMKKKYDHTTMCMMFMPPIRSARHIHEPFTCHPRFARLADERCRWMPAQTAPAHNVSGKDKKEK